MFNRLIHLLGNMFSTDDPNTQQVQESLRLSAENSFIYDITNGRSKGYNREAIISGHNKIGNFIHRGIQIQTKVIQEG